MFQICLVQSLSCVRLFATPWTAARQASLSVTNSWSMLKLMFIESVMPSNHLILCCPLLLLPSTFPSIRVFSNESVLCISDQSIGASASASVLPMDIQHWFSLGWTGLISLQSKGLSRVFYNTTVQKHAFLSLSFLYSPVLTSIAPHSSTLACKIPWMEEPGGLQSMGSLRVGRNWATSLSLFTFMHWRRKWQPTPVFFPGESQGRGSLVGCCLWGRIESDRTEAT